MPNDAPDSPMLRSEINPKLDAVKTWLSAAVVPYSLLGAQLDLWPMNWVRVPFDWLRHHAFSEGSVVWSAMVCITVFVLAAEGVLPRVERLVLRLAQRYPSVAARFQASPRSTKVPLKQWQITLRVGLGLALAAWLAAPIVWRYVHWREAVDNDAVYRPVSADGPALATHGEHLTLQGKVLLGSRVDIYLVRSSRDPDYYFVPLAPSNWHEGDPIHWVLYLDALEDLPGYSHGHLTWNLTFPVLGRVVTAIPLTMKFAMGRMGAPLASDYRVLKVLESQDGIRLKQQTDWQAVLWFCGGLGVFCLILATTSGLVLRNQERQKRLGK